MLDRRRRYFALQGDRVAAAAVVVAVLASLMVSYPRAPRRSASMQGRDRHASGARRDPGDGLVFAKGASLGNFQLLKPAVYVLAALSVITFQRICARPASFGVTCTPADRLLRPAIIHPVVPLGQAGSREPPRTGLAPTRQSTRDQGTLNGARDSNGAPPQTAPPLPVGKVRVAIIGVGNRASASSRASTTTATPNPPSRSGLMHVDLGGYHVRDIEFTAASTSTRRRSARTSATRSGRDRTTR